MLRISFFAFWLTLATFAATTLTAWHSVTLPTEPTRAKSGRSHPGKWLLTHFLSADCLCSQALARHLQARGPLAAADEEVVVIGPVDSSAHRDTAQRKMIESLNRAGFQAATMTVEAAASQEGVEGVPLLNVTGPDGIIRFRGGYRDRGAPPDRYLEVAILTSLRASQPVPATRVYGCATSRRLRTLLDPLSLKSLSLP
jgi:hypothetical protein